MLKNAKVPVLGFAAFSGTGKTSLLLKLLPQLRTRELVVGVIKHAHHTFETDPPGKDSYELRKAGTDRILVASRHRWALMMETEDHVEPRLNELLEHLPQDGLDLIVVEGFKHEVFPKIELHRPSLGNPLLYPDDPSFIAIASDQPLSTQVPIPLLNLNNIEEITAFVIDEFLRNAVASRRLPATLQTDSRR